MLRCAIGAHRAVCVRDGCVTLPARTGDSHALKLNGRTPHMPLRAAIEFERVVMGYGVVLRSGRGVERNWDFSQAQPYRTSTNLKF